MTTVADVFIDTLEEAGVKRIYGIVGDSLNGLTNALQKRKTISWVHTRHEEVAAFAAGAEAQLTGELTVCAGSCGPGNVHLINGLYDCQRSNAPVLAIAAHIPSPEVGGDYFQETHPGILFKECSVYCEVISSVEQMPRILKIAMQTAIAKRGVAVIVISGDLAMQEMPAQHAPAWTPAAKPIVVPDNALLKQLAKELNEAERVTVFCGIGAADAHKPLMAMCDKLKSPVVHTLRGKPFVEYDNPYDVGMTGLIGFSSGYYAMESCDLLLLLGTSFPYRQFYPEHAKIIQIDIEGSQLGKRTDINLGVVGDVNATLEALLPLLKPKTDSSHLEKAVNHYRHARRELDDLATAKPGKKLIHPQYLAKLINEESSGDAVFTCDVGTPTVWAARYLMMNGKRRLLGSFNHGSMANALAQAIGAQASYPDRQVVALCGDGGFSMLMGDMLTLIQEQLPVKIIIFNNGTLGFVEMEMHVGGMLEYSTELDNPNFAQMAGGAGIHSQRVEDPADLRDALKAAFKHQGPALIDARVNRNELVMPPAINIAQVKGFSLYMMKAIINGQGTEIFNLVKNNLWR
ncbi:Pyruvate dehydrogenase [Legionella birminghamensis]|uniref:Pyruvate dehydrogenase [ubiquinone] n=1 Tax=Legionella birminghamensis TaxID=28083 RepID=A0A378I6U1_9GAMM|nr:ubiquinone-dependent pyruvate dehydrogenase [Legionella birminghamensis]KTC73891.1 Pyruvate dehydrogenase [Legionella birminghamensis]STX30465.1 pyruvate dehydrogenase (pyruvate oxidase), thiamin-dependent, FAD-binding [Legionella birminghamensis]